jgi:ornithine carbamoyltransferase
MTIRSYLSVLDISPEETRALLRLAAKLKEERASGHLNPYLEKSHIALYFEKPSVRTRTSFTVGIHELGGHVVELGTLNTKVGSGEHIEDFATVVGRYIDLLVARVFDHSALEGMSKMAAVPVINALSDDSHPCQALADIMTIIERHGEIEGEKIVFVGEGNNVAVSLAILGANLGAEVTVVSPEGYGLPAEVLKIGDGLAGSIKQSSKLEESVREAHVIYTDTWISMGQESESAKRRELFSGFRVDSALVEKATGNAIVMHCLPAVRGEEITKEVMYGSQSAIWDQAENRLHAQKALMIKMLRP